jgi:hypothetical protein
MSFKQFLLEAKHTKMSVEETIELIKKDCKPFLKHGVALYRGMEQRTYGESGSRGVRFDRKPLTSSSKFSEFMFDYMYKIGAPSREQSMFCTRDQTGTWDYGEEYTVFPKGNFRYFYFEDLSDAYTEIESALDGSSVYQPWMVEDESKEELFTRDEKDVLGQVHWYFNKTGDIRDAVDDYHDELIKIVESKELDDELEEMVIGNLEDSRSAIYRVFKKLEYFQVNKNLNKAEDQEITIQCKEYYYILLDDVDEKSIFKELGIKK